MNAIKTLLLAASASTLALAFAPEGMAQKAARKPAKPAVSAGKAAPVWPHDASDIKPDPAVKYGVLANGMRYALMKNATPKGQVSIRLRFSAGSLDENDNQLGLAHFIEHMAFNGSENVKPDEFVQKLQAYGLSFGADTNAGTFFDQTFYQLDLPRNDAEIVDYAMLLMRETAGRISFSPEEIEKERGVVLSEERLRDGPQLRTARAQLALILKGQRAANRFPIGTPEILKTAPRAEFLDLYQRNYRPDRAILVVTGDMDPVAIEADIKKRFGDWQGVGPAAQRPDLGKVDQTPFLAAFHQEAQGANSVSINFVTPWVAERDTIAQRETDTIRQTALTMLNQRFADISRKADAPFISARASGDDLIMSARSYSLNATHQPGKWQPALAAIEQELRRAIEFGFREDELERVIANTRGRLNAAVKGTDTRQTPALANGIFSAYGDDTVFTDPATDLALFESARSKLTLAATRSALKDAFSQGVIRIFASGSEAIPDAPATIEKAFRVSAATPVTKAAEEAAVAFSYSFGTPGKVASRTEAADLGATFVRFENGVKLNIRPSKVEQNVIQVQVRLDGGTIAFPKSMPGLGILLSPGVIDGGLGKLTSSQLDKALTGRIVRAGFAAGADSFTFSGRTAPADLGLEMELLAARVTDPGFRPEGVERFKGFLPNVLQQVDSTAIGRAQFELSAFLRSGDVRFRVLPTEADGAAYTVNDVKNFISPILGGAPIEVTIVGDVTVEDAITHTAKTFGALPKRESAPPLPADARDIRFPAGGTVGRFEHGGRPDQSVGLIGWKAADARDIATTGKLQMLREVLQNQATEILREKQGATYSPTAVGEFDEKVKDFGYVGMTIETPPASLDGFFVTAEEVAKSLRDTPLSPEALERAKRPLIEGINTARKGNGYWLGLLADAQTTPDRLTRIRTQLELLEAVTPADIQALARKYLTSDRAVRMTVTPRAGK